MIAYEESLRSTYVSNIIETLKIGILSGWFVKWEKQPKYQTASYNMNLPVLFLPMMIIVNCKIRVFCHSAKEYVRFTYTKKILDPFKSFHDACPFSEKFIFESFEGVLSHQSKRLKTLPDK